MSRDRNIGAPPRLIALMSLQSLTSRRLPIALAAALALAALAGVIAFASLGGSADGAKSKVIGKLKGDGGQKCRAKDNEPDDRNKKCKVIASVTGVQVLADGKRNSFKAPANGRIVAYGMNLGRPEKKARSQESGDPDNPSLPERFPGGPFDGRATSQLAILKSQKKGKYKLLRKSKDFRAQTFLDNSPVVALSKPLRVRKGDFIGLTTPSWLPAFGGSSKDRWRASQPVPRKQCSDEKTQLESKPLRKDGTSRKFTCSYGARLLYWAYFEPAGKGDREGGGGGGGGNNRIQTLGAAPASAPSGGDLPSGGIAP